MNCGIGLYCPKNHLNIGAALRAAECFGVKMVAVTGTAYRRASTDVMASYKRIPLIRTDNLRTLVPYDWVPVAVEFTYDAKDLVTYEHPKQAFYVFGPEYGSLGKNVLSWCRDVVKIPAYSCLNLAAAVNVVLYDRTAKLARTQQ